MLTAWLTSLCRWDLDDIVSQTHVLAEAVANVVDRTVCFNVGVRCDPINGQIFTQVHLKKKAHLSSSKI